MASTGTNNDSCYIHARGKRNGSIFDYVTDASRHIRSDECVNFQPPFIAYVPRGIPDKNVDIENNLKGIDRTYSKCTDPNSKWMPTDANLIQGLSKTNVNGLKECN